MDEGFLDATALAEYLVKKGVAFREGHGVVGTLVAMCEKDGIKLGDVELSVFQKTCGAIEGDVYEVLGGASVVGKYMTEGAGGLEQTARQVEFWEQVLKGR